MNKNVQLALEIIRNEYMNTEDCIERYNLREGVFREMNKVRDDKREQLRKNDGNELLSHIQSCISEQAGVKLNVIEEIKMTDSLEKICEFIGVDDLEWLELIMALETTFDVVFDYRFERADLSSELTFSDIYEIISSK